MLTLVQIDMPLVQWGVVCGASLAAAVCDLRTRRIPNLLTGPLFVGGLVFAVLAAGGGGLLDAVGGSLLLFVPYLALYVYAGGGAGDAKLMAAVGSWLGLIYGAIALFSVSIAGVILAIGYSVAHRRVPVGAAGSATSVPTGRAEGSLSDLGDGSPGDSALSMPYGMAIGVGVWIAAAGVLAWQL